MEQIATLEVKNEQNPLEELSLDVVKGTKKQQKQESESDVYFDNNGLFMAKNEFEELIVKNSNSRWLQTKTIHNDCAFGTYFKVPEAYEETVRVYVVTYPHTAPGYIQTSFYVYNGEKLFRAWILDDVSEIIDQLKLKWLHDFRFYVTALIKELQEEKAKVLNQIN